MSALKNDPPKPSLAESRLYDRQIEHLALPLIRHYREFLDGKKATAWLRGESQESRQALIAMLTKLRDEMQESAAAFDRIIAKAVSIDQKQFEWGGRRNK